jgi:hypothetical protein
MELLPLGINLFRKEYDPIPEGLILAQLLKGRMVTVGYFDS